MKPKDYLDRIIQSAMKIKVWRLDFHSKNESDFVGYVSRGCTRMKVEFYVPPSCYSADIPRISFEDTVTGELIAFYNFKFYDQKLDSVSCEYPGTSCNNEKEFFKLKPNSATARNLTELFFQKFKPVMFRYEAPYGINKAKLSLDELASLCEKPSVWKNESRKYRMGFIFDYLGYLPEGFRINVYKETHEYPRIRYILKATRSTTDDRRWLIDSRDFKVERSPEFRILNASGEKSSRKVKSVLDRVDAVIKKIDSTFGTAYRCRARAQKREAERCAEKCRQAAQNTVKDIKGLLE
ncbi:hypothetical protein KY329_00185 [Candidatus Woesearchaeota archaeon]|nr:hypothetical protein [Candidatus Woesearchaeota archaeon]